MDEAKVAKPHILSHCNAHAVARTNRHNAVLNRLLKAYAHAAGFEDRFPVPPVQSQIDVAPGTTVYLNRKIPFSRIDRALRPDFVVVDQNKKTVLIVDACVPFENGQGAMDAARGDKHRKYEPVRADLVRQGYKVFLEAFVVGALGAWDPANRMVTRALGISDRYANTMAKLCERCCHVVP